MALREHWFCCIDFKFAWLAAFVKCQRLFIGYLDCVVVHENLLFLLYAYLLRVFDLQRLRVLSNGWGRPANEKDRRLPGY